MQGFIPIAPPRRLAETDRARVEAHLLALGANDRYGRFATALSDAGIAAYAARIDFAGDLCFGIVETDGGLSGFIHLAVCGSVAELGASVATQRRRQGRARRLFATALAAASHQGLHEIHLATGHPAARKICSELGHTILESPSYPRARVLIPTRSATTAPSATIMPDPVGTLF